MRVQNTALQTSASLVADILTFIAFIGAFFVSFLSHLRSIRPSTVLTLFLSFVVLLNCPRIRTFWLIYQHQDNDVPVSLPTISLLVEVLLMTALFLESLEKRKHVQGAEVCDTPEQYSGFWKRTSFAWLAHTFGQGYSIILSVGDLPSLDPRLKSDLIVEQLQLRWSRCDQKASHSMLRACLRTFWLSLASGAIPRLCLTGFTFAQPFLINTLTTYVGLSHPDVDHGRSLIGASALVYIGMAVSLSARS